MSTKKTNDLDVISSRRVNDGKKPKHQIKYRARCIVTNMRIIQ